MASDGAKSPALPPEAMVSEAATSFASASNSSRCTAAQPPGIHAMPEMAICTAP